jgi:hypothetical protein
MFTVFAVVNDNWQVEMLFTTRIKAEEYMLENRYRAVEEMVAW